MSSDVFMKEAASSNNTEMLPTDTCPFSNKLYQYPVMFFSVHSWQKLWFCLEPVKDKKLTVWIVPSQLHVPRLFGHAQSNVWSSD